MRRTRIRDFHFSLDRKKEAKRETFRLFLPEKWQLIRIAASEDEAVYITALLNSTSLSNAIKDFQPEGGFGKRHIHTIPYKIMPHFDAENTIHQDLVQKARGLIDEWLCFCGEGKFAALLQPNSGSLNSRRRQQQDAIRTLPSDENYEAACCAVLQV